MSTTSFSTPKKQTPNPHPYAIKTTSTALLSHNSSSSSTASSTHHYIPPSPSPSPTQTGFGGEITYTRHRYSTSESPRPLPPPPALLGSFKNDDDDDTPRRAQRAYSLPQEIKLPEDPKRWTPAEVSIYLTSSLNAATGRGHNISTPVAHDIAAFVKDKKITGKSFLKLNEVDLEEYGINQLWRTTLLDASRALRRNILRGRIWDNPTERYDEYNDDNNLSSNSNFAITNRKRSLSTTSTTSESRGRVRDMVDTLERSSSTSSSDLDEEGSCTSGRRNKDARDRVHHHHHRHRSLEQQQQQQLQLQQQGRLPQRGSVSTLFGTSGPAPDTPEQEIEDKDSTITAHARRNVNGNEPRLLPFPPTGPRTSNSIANHHYAHLVTPSHTGTSHPLPPSPLDHARNQQTTPYYLDSNHVLNTQPLHHQPFIFPSHSQHNHTPNTFDYYELGFKKSLPLSPPPPLGPPIRSPNSQRYVVQHNNVQPPSTTPGGVGGHSTGGGSKGRLLPYPPIVGEAELFHPRPRMGMGVGGLAGGLEDGLDGEGDETVYHSALETQTESADSETGGGEEGSATSSAETSGSGNEVETGVESNATDGVELPEKAKGEGEEPSIQDLLLAQSQPRPHSVEAWEMELGETVKRISSNGSSAPASGSIMSVGGTKTRTRPRKRELMMDEIGRKTGRMSGKVDGLSEGGSRKKTTTGVLDPELFEAPDSAASGVKGDVDDYQALKASVPLSDSAASASTAASTSISITRQSALDERESSIAERESTISERESTIVVLESSLNVRESSIAERESLITERESSITGRESSLDIRESSITSQESTFASKSISCQSAFDERESSIAERESTITILDSSLKVRESSITERESLITERESSITDRESSLDNRESSITAREFTISEHESTITARESALTTDESEIQRRMGDVQQREVEVGKRESEAEKREQEVSEREMRVERREVELKEWYQGKLTEIERMLVDVPPPIPATSTTLASTWTCIAESRWPPSPMEFARRLCATFLLPVLGENRTPGFLLPTNGVAASSDSSTTTTTTTTSTSTSTTTTTTTKTLPVPFWSLKRDFFVNRLLGAAAGGGSYIVLMSIGICVILLRGVVRRVLRVGGFWRR